MIECQSNYITSCIRRLIEAEGKSIDCRKANMILREGFRLSFFLFQTRFDDKVAELHL